MAKMRGSNSLIEGSIIVYSSWNQKRGMRFPNTSITKAGMRFPSTSILKAPNNLVRGKIRSTSTRRKIEDHDIFFCLSDIHEVSYSSDDSLWLWLVWKEKRKEAVEVIVCLDGTGLPYSILVVWNNSTSATKYFVFCFWLFGKWGCWSF